MPHAHEAESQRAQARETARDARDPSAAGLVGFVARLQQTAGNAAVGRLLQRDDVDDQALASALAPVPQPRAPAPKPLDLWAKPSTGEPERHDLAFIMGKDPPGTPARKGFYDNAAEYFASELPFVRIVKDRTSLAAIFEYIRGLTGTVGHLYIVTHANEEGNLAFPLGPGDPDNRVTHEELVDALQKSPDLFRLQGQVDARTVIHIKGCNIGRNQTMVELIDKTFGALGTVLAPTHQVGYARERNTPVWFETIGDLWVKAEANETLSDEDLAAEFAFKYPPEIYPFIPSGDWKRLIAGSRARGTFETKKAGSEIEYRLDLGTEFKHYAPAETEAKYYYHSTYGPPTPAP
jgi:hypothetical protein